MPRMRISVRLWVPCALVTLAGVACATATNSDLGGSVGVDAGQDGTVVIVQRPGSGSDSGLPTVTIYTEGGTMNPQTDSGQTTTSSGGYTSTGEDGGFPPPEGDGGFSGSGYSGSGYSGSGHHSHSGSGSYSHSGSGSHSHGSSGTGTSSTSSTVPTTCAEADGNYGCCDGNTVYYCQNGSLTSLKCQTGSVCGWNSTQSYYDCVASPGGAGPSQYPEACK